MIVIMIESLIDFVPNKDGSYIPLPGGSPFNTAIALGRLNVDVSFYGNISNDFFGTKLKQYLKDNNVLINYVNNVENETTLAFVGYSENSNPSYTFYTNNTADISFNKITLPFSKNEVKCLLFGSYSLGLEPSGTTAEQIIMNEKDNYIIALDPNMRLSISKNKDSYKNRIQRLIRNCHILKLSTEDFFNIYGKDMSIDKILNFLIEESSSEIIFLTDGEKGSHAITRTGIRCSTKTYKIKLADTVGAGDTFFGSILAKLEQKNNLSKENLKTLKGQELMELIDFASKASAINCTKKGANPPTIEEINNFS